MSTFGTVVSGKRRRRVFAAERFLQMLISSQYNVNHTISLTNCVGQFTVDGVYNLNIQHYNTIYMIAILKM